MKQLITLLLLVYSALCAAQETKPSKQETMDWIAQKFKNHINTNPGIYKNDTTFPCKWVYHFVSYSHGVIELKEVTEFDIGHEGMTTRNSLIRIYLDRIEGFIVNENRLAIVGLNVCIKANEEEIQMYDMFTLYEKWEDGFDFYRLKLVKDITTNLSKHSKIWLMPILLESLKKYSKNRLLNSIAQ